MRARRPRAEGLPRGAQPAARAQGVQGVHRGQALEDAVPRLVQAVREALLTANFQCGSKSIAKPCFLSCDELAERLLRADVLEDPQSRRDLRGRLLLVPPPDRGGGGVPGAGPGEASAPIRGAGGRLPARGVLGLLLPHGVRHRVRGGEQAAHALGAHGGSEVDAARLGPGRRHEQVMDRGGDGTGAVAVARRVASSDELSQVHRRLAEDPMIAGPALGRGSDVLQRRARRLVQAGLGAPPRRQRRRRRRRAEAGDVARRLRPRGALGVVVSGVAAPTSDRHGLRVGHPVSAGRGHPDNSGRGTPGGHWRDRLACDLHDRLHARASADLAAVLAVRRGGAPAPDRRLREVRAQPQHLAAAGRELLAEDVHLAVEVLGDLLHRGLLAQLAVDARADPEEVLPEPAQLRLQLGQRGRRGTRSSVRHLREARPRRRDLAGQEVALLGRRRRRRRGAARWSSNGPQHRRVGLGLVHRQHAHGGLARRQRGGGGPGARRVQQDRRDHDWSEARAGRREAGGCRRARLRTCRLRRRRHERPLASDLTPQAPVPRRCGPPALVQALLSGRRA
mmetsp:Transcript_14576/g.43668  ORF Transcript_14576/g.43668 Transcript_14576/m.43668 type:complete len:565 (+) Transcript_14576:537-2231(+)